MPRKHGGLDAEPNAAPLCPSCHDTYGANPQKRKLLREARDAWFRICDQRFVPRLQSLEASLSAVEASLDAKAGPRVWFSVDGVIAALFSSEFTEVGLPATSWSSIESLLTIFLSLRFWPDADWRLWRSTLLRAYGHRGAGRLLLQVLREQRLVLGHGITPRQFERSLGQFRTMALVVVAATLENQPRLEFSFKRKHHLVARLADRGVKAPPANNALQQIAYGGR